MTNDAAERLHSWIHLHAGLGEDKEAMAHLFAALAAERRAGAAEERERIRVRMQKYQSIYGNVRIEEVFAILDAEAER